MTQELALDATPGFGIGRILARSFAVFGRNLGTFLAVTFLTNLPFILIATWNDYNDLHPGLGGPDHGTRLGLSFVQTITAALVQAALTYGTLEDLRGNRPTIGACFQNGWRSGSRLFRGALVYSLLIVLAFVALIVPGVILYLMWWVYVPVIVVEGLGVNASFSRSRALTAGRRWRILGLSLLTVLFLIVGGLVVMLPVQLLGGPFAGQIAVTFVAVLYGAFLSVVTAVGYYALRIEKEGIDIEAIAQVFA
jgi:hypothetical protein